MSRSWEVAARNVTLSITRDASSVPSFPASLRTVILMGRLSPPNNKSFQMGTVDLPQETHNIETPVQTIQQTPGTSYSVHLLVSRDIQKCSTEVKYSNK
eukprot:TRINITY_DN2768_c0_g1_i2.p1 TRINITY_DN2768_c0_g1~~TRINITY_DN2768_c0_g1_i2.p1  ORF type:complete len:109 (+),score=7.57 TRINITY_DN2768_c0_g1_i2:33-329(+)